MDDKERDCPATKTKIGLLLVGQDHDEFEDLLEAHPALNAHAAARLAVAVGVAVLRADPSRVMAMLAERRVHYSVGRRR